MRYAPFAVATLALALGGAAPVSAASFDCDGAKSELEMTICGDDGLSGMDELMEQAYAGAEVRATTTKSRKTLASDQKAWLKSRAPCAADLGCLIGMYDQRIEFLNQWMP